MSYPKEASCQKRENLTEAFLRLALPLLKIDADDGQVGIWKAPLPLGTAELKMAKNGLKECEYPKSKLPRHVF